MANILNKLLRMAVGKIPEGAGALPDAPSDPTKRNLLKGGVAVGALSAIPVVKKVAPKIVDEFSSQVPSGIKMDESDVANLIADLQVKKGSEVFQNLDQELDFAKDLYKTLLGKNISKKEVLERDMADRLHWMKTDDNYGHDASSIGEYRITDLFEIYGGGPSGPLSPYDFANQSEVLKTVEKHMGEADQYNYGGAAGDDLTDKALKEEFGDKADELDDDAIEKWLESKVGNTTYFKKLMKASEK